MHDRARMVIAAYLAVRRRALARPGIDAVKFAAAVAAFTAAACVAAPSGLARAPARVSVGGLAGTGEWIMTQDYGGGAGVRFDQRFSFQRRGRKAATIPLGGGVLTVPIRVNVQSSATGALLDATVTPAQLRSYTCTATSSTNTTATVRLIPRRRGFRVTTVALRALDPGSPDCTEPGSVFWPTSTTLFTRALKRRSDVPRTSLFAPIELRFPAATADCGDPLQVGTCSEQVAWSGTLKLRRRS
jgi:hypothetical protein